MFGFGTVPRVLIVIVGVCISAASGAQQARVGPVSSEDRTSAIRAFINGDFARYKSYLEASLAWHLKQLETQPFDTEKIRVEIVKYAKQNGVGLTVDELDQKTEEAHKLIQGFGGGWQRVHREQIRELYDSLALLCSVMSDADCELKNRKLASQYE